MTRPKGQPHPSGRPVSKSKWGTETRTRRPYDGPLSPGLQRTGSTYAVGFTVGQMPDDEFED